ncbi:hypothetical protein [Streptomyces sp. WAC00263]|uniref:hypothetical protein n=1 Tax=Streptomyces sp. WAC00263 TaxID=1917422 RepID=UPI0015EFAC69|nr:hypothetical protein [Streptomyces sp. WAC00263]
MWWHWAERHMRGEAERMAWGGGLSGLDESKLNRVFLHPEHRANLANVTWLLERCDAADGGFDDVVDVYWLARPLVARGIRE